MLFRSKKYGPKIGGVFVAIPFIATPILLAIYFEQGKEFFHQAIIGTYAGQAGVLIYIFFVHAFSPKTFLANMFHCSDNELLIPSHSALSSNY